MRNATVVLAVLAMLAGTVWADAMVYEGFETGAGKDYAADVTIKGINPGNPEATTGFEDTAWSSESAFADSVDFKTRTAGLSYGSLVTTDGALEHYRSSGNAFGKSITRDFDYTYNSNEAWWSVLFNYNFSSDTTCAVELVTGEASDRNSRITVFANGDVKIFMGGGSGSTLELGTISSGETHLVVLKAVGKDGHYDDISAWLDPTDLTNLGTPDDTGEGIFRELALGGVTAPFDSLLIESYNGLAAGEDFKVDELRLGTTQGDVLPIPEPATMVLLGLGGIGVLLRRKRR